MFTWLTRVLGHRRSSERIAALGCVLALATLPIGFFTDDYPFIARLDGQGPKPPTVFGLYDFVGGDASETYALIRRGPFPWWTALDLKLRLWRPLSSALFALDHALFGHAPLGYHVHAFFLYSLFVAGVALLFHLAVPASLRGFCLLVFALNAAHSEPVGWLSSRHLLIAGVPSLWGLVAHVAFRERGFRPGRWLAPLGLFVGLLGGEAALGLAMLWIAYELTGAHRKGALGLDVRRLAVPVGMVSAYLLVYKLADYGSAHNAAYFEPLSDPRRFAAACGQRIPILLGEMLLGIPSAFVVAFDAAPFIVLGLLATIGAATLLVAVYREVDGNAKRAIRWLALGALGSIVLSAGGFPGSRLLLVPSIGGSAIVGAILGQGWHGATSTSVAFMRRMGWGILFAIHVVLAPVMFLASSAMLAKIGARTAQIDASLDGVLPASGTATAPSVFLIASDPVAGIYVGAARAVRAPGTFTGWSVLSMARATHDIERPDDRTLVIRTDRPMLQGAFDGVFRDPARSPFAPGDRVDLDEATVTVLSSEKGYPTAIEVRFVAPLEDERFRIIAWQAGRLLPLRVAIGDHVVIPWTKGPTGFL